MSFTKVKRIRKPDLNPEKYLRLHRAEFGHDFKKKNLNNNNYYPDSKKLINKLSKFHKIKESNINVGLGSESLIKDIFFWFFINSKNKQIKFGHGKPNYFMYSILGKIMNFRESQFNIFPDKKESFSIKFIKKFIIKNKLNFFILVNPSHPFEINFTLKDLKELISFCKKKNVILIIDEVYQGLGSESALQFIKKYNNLIIVKSFSKAYGYPGLRLGYIISNDKLIQEIESLRLAIELPSDTINTSIKFLNNKKKYLLANVEKIKSARNFAHKSFKIRNIPSYGTHGNSVTFTHKKILLIGKYLKNKKIIINYSYPRPLNKYGNITTTSINNLKIFFSRLDIFLKSEK